MNKPKETSLNQQHLDEYLRDLLKGSSIEDGNILGHFDDLETFNLIAKKMKDSGYSFSVRNSDVRIKKPKDASAEKLKSGEKGQNTVFYHSKSTSIQFFGLPFTVEKTTNYQCTYGSKYYKSKARQPKGDSSQDLSLPVKKRTNVISKKMGCIATMTIKKVIVYPDYPLDDVKDWRKKKRLIETLRKDLNTGEREVKSFSRYFVSISIQSRHNHPPFFHNYLSPRKKRRYSDATPTTDEDKIKNNNCTMDEDESNNWVTLYSVPKEDAEVTKEESAPVYPVVTYMDGDEVKTVTVKVGGGSNWEQPADSEGRTYHLETIQCPSTQDLQLLFKEKLKRLYTISESCENSELLLQLLSDLEQTDVALINDIGYDPTL